ncbi:MAG: hypothetical protein WCG75_07125 [Armatimonadota bacterium]
MTLQTIIPLFPYNENMYPPDISNSFALTLIGIGAKGCLSCFTFLIWRAKRKNGLSNLSVGILTVLFLGSLFLAAFGTQFKIDSAISSGPADDK